MVGVGMLFGNMADWNVVHKIFSSMPTAEGIVYLLVGVAAVMKISGCRCKKCRSNVCSMHGAMDGKMDSGMEGKM